jgi:hypothetical protein
MAPPRSRDDLAAALTRLLTPRVFAFRFPWSSEPRGEPMNLVGQ